MSCISSLIVSEPSLDKMPCSVTFLSWTCMQCGPFPFLRYSLAKPLCVQPVCGFVARQRGRPIRTQWELHHTVRFMDTPAAHPFGVFSTLLASWLSIWCSFVPTLM